MARALNLTDPIMRLTILVAIVALAACRGEPVPRDYQNAPPAMTHPPQTQSDTPAAHGMEGTPAEPTAGVEGTSAPYKEVTPPPQPTTTTMPDTPPATGT